VRHDRVGPAQTRRAGARRLSGRFRRRRQNVAVEAFERRRRVVVTI
jgi:hypothetical protein